jgi:hypothetical protein
MSKWELVERDQFCDIPRWRFCVGGVSNGASGQVVPSRAGTEFYATVNISRTCYNKDEAMMWAEGAVEASGLHEQTPQQTEVDDA